MTSNHNQESEHEERYGKMRRQDRLVDDSEWIASFLRRVPFGFIATAQDAQPSITPNIFFHDEEAGVIYIHSAAKGRMREAIEGNERVCFCVAEMGRLLPADTAIELSVEYASVVIYGRASVVTETSPKEGQE